MATACTNHPSVTQGIVRCTRCGRPYCPNCVVRLRGFAYCGQCKGEQVRDIQSGTVAGEIELATIGRRFGALWIDSLLFLAVGLVGGVVAGIAAGASRMSPQATSGLTLVVTAFIILGVIVYEGLMLQARGQTLGKMALGIKVVTPDGNDISAGQAWGRAVIRQVFFYYLAIINYLPAAFTKQRTCIHDLVCKTRVMRVRS